jgi:APA family basic amino acid/polyamine antiporter
MNYRPFFRKKSIHQINRELRENDESKMHESLGKHLGVRDLTAFGIAAIVGAGIFSTIGKASFDGGPAVILLFVFTAVACSFTAFAYAEFASMVPVSGSAYTYSYVAFGEIIAWIIGWALIMEYAIGNITVAISWSDYFTGLMEHGLHIKIPNWAQMDYFTAYNGYNKALNLMESGKSLSQLDTGLQLAYNAWATAPKIGSFHLVADLPALMIIILVTALVYKGMKESRNISNAMVIVKLSIILVVVTIGVFYVDTSNWNPFAPNGISGVLKGVSAVFFAYIGFDAISTTAEECKDPQRDLPRGMMWAIVICTILYVIIALVLTGMVNYSELNVGDPLAYVFEQLDLKWLSGLIGISAVVAMASVLLVFQMGQPRIWMSMSRDGLLPKRFSKIHPKYKTPSFATLIVGFAVAVPALFLNLTTVTDLCSIGTLFAFAVVCGGVLILQNKSDLPRGKFKTPYVNAKWIMPALVLTCAVISFTFNNERTMHFLTNEKELVEPGILLTSLPITKVRDIKVLAMQSDKERLLNAGEDIESYLTGLENGSYVQLLKKVHIPEDQIYISGFKLVKNKFPTYIFLLMTLVLTYLAFRNNLSLIPMLGLISCLYLMSELSLSNWIGFGIWLVIGLMIYLGYSHNNSRLNSSVV